MRKRILFLCLWCMFCSGGIVYSFPYPIGFDEQYPTDEALKKLAVEKKIIPGSSDHAFVAEQFDKKNTILMWLVMTREQKLDVIEGLRTLYWRQGITINHPAVFYVDQINKVIYDRILQGEDAVRGIKGLGHLLRILAALEGDFNDGRSRLDILGDVLTPSEMEDFKRAFPEEYHNLEQLDANRK